MMMKSLAVIDVETTGLNPYRHDRVIEVAAVLLLPGQGIAAEFVTLVNPERDIGPSRIHGITASDIVNAPRFSEIAANLADILRGATALVGHNVRFDISFLQSEYRRVGVAMPNYVTLDTMNLAGRGTLTACCAKHGVKYDGRAHAALDDARATACLLQKIILNDPDLLTSCVNNNPPVWPHLTTPCGRLLPRESAHCANPPLPSYVQRLAERLSDGTADVSQPEGERDYRALLWRSLEDGRIDESEGDALLEVATNWGLTFSRVEAIHLGYLSELAKAARADQQITDTERREIQKAAQLLGFGNLSDEQFQDLMRSCEISVGSDKSVTLEEEWSGKAVCFTGECACCIRGQLISREMAERIAVENGLLVMPSVTKKLDLLVVADPNTQSGKANKARQYGIRIVHEPVFWRALGITVD
jgi:DNA polymerase III subunit epsilon